MEANGISIFYEDYGSGVPLLLIHGGIVNSSVWKPHIPEFARYFRFVVLRPGLPR
jgi:pimeloyl-ACP methyl ester carboxylesterase